MNTSQPARSPSWKWWVCGALLLATFLNYMDRQSLSVLLPELKTQYQLAEKRIGLLEGCFGFAFAFGSLFFGFVADRTGPRLLYPIVLVGWSFAGIATGFAGQPWVTSHFEFPDDEPGAGPFRWFVMCRVILGFFEAGHWPCALITVRQILTARDRPFGNALLQSGASLGAILVPLYVELVQRFDAGWEFVFWSVGVVGLLWVPLWSVLIRRDDFRVMNPVEQVETSSAPTSFLRQLLVLAIVVSCLTISWQFLRAWLALYLQTTYGFSSTTTRLCVSGYFVSADIGCLLAGILVTVLVGRGWSVDSARRLGFFGFSGVTSLAATVPFLAMIPILNSPIIAVWLLMLSGAGILGLHPYYYAFAQELPAKRMGIYSGALAATGWVASSVFQIYIGAEIQATKSYGVGLVIVGCAPMVAFAALMLLWRKPGRY